MSEVSPSKEKRMINPHIVVGAGRRCMCGVYDGAPLTCGQILAALAAFQSLVVECAEPLSDDSPAETGLKP